MKRKILMTIISFLKWNEKFKMDFLVSQRLSRFAIPLVILGGLLGFGYLLCLQFELINEFWLLFEKLTLSLGGRALSLTLCKGLGCPGSLALAIGFAIKALLTSGVEPNMMNPSSSAPVSESPQSQPVLEGRPIPKEQEWEAISSGKYCASVVHISGEISDPSTLFQLGKLNGTLLHIQDSVFKGVMQPHYTRVIQEELDRMDEDSLPAGLDFIRRRELYRWGLT
jgi:hypothetical protein